MPNPFLSSLHVAGLGVIDEAELHFGDGFNVITGETGAGKTLLVDALTLCLGGESRTPRRGAELSVTAVFTDQSGKETSMSRVLPAGGRLRSALDGVATSSEALRLLGESLLSLHGQHDSLKLKNRGEVLALLDRFADIDARQLLELRAVLSELHREQRSLGGDVSARTKELDFLAFQIQEIENASLADDGELESALEELRGLTEVREHREAIAQSTAILDGDDGSLLDSLMSVLTALPHTGVVGATREEMLEQAKQLRIRVSELRGFIDDDANEAQRYDALETRIEMLRNLLRKYGGSIAAVKQHLIELRERHDFLSTAEQRSDQIGVEIAEVEQQVVRESSRIRSLRETAAARFSHLVQGQLVRVALPNAEVSVAVGGDDGSEVDILFRPNPGAGSGLLQAIASGGELSRVLLAISLVTSVDQNVTVFDEIDAGVGGTVAESIGECLFDLARTRQVIAVTHLASVAARANKHFVVRKDVVDGRTVTKVEVVEGDARVTEISRMLAGDAATAESRALAERLLQAR